VAGTVNWLHAQFPRLQLTVLAIVAGVYRRIFSVPVPATCPVKHQATRAAPSISNGRQRRHRGAAHINRPLDLLRTTEHAGWDDSHDRTGRWWRQSECLVCAELDGESMCPVVLSSVNQWPPSTCAAQRTDRIYQSCACRSPATLTGVRRTNQP
jgi:hypothetical protein